MLDTQEQAILDSIVVASDNDPTQPEFPPQSPRFPATSVRRIRVPGFTNIWLKDESENPTGTHKDRMAWEIVVTYRDILKAKQRGVFSGPLPAMSLISSGSAAVAVQTMLARYHLPNLRVLLDHGIEESVIEQLRGLGCSIYFTDLSARPLTYKDILIATENPDGFDITSNDALEPSTRFYDWLAYEILNESPEYCFVPFGTGHLYKNILQICKKEVVASQNDPRFRGDSNIIRACHFIGATTNYRLTLATKLYSPHLPFVNFDEQWIRLFQRAGYCGNKSGVVSLEESYLLRAIHIAKELGITCEPSGVAGLAMLLQMEKDVPHDAKILIINTGKTKL